MEEKKFYYEVGIDGEDYTHGKILLTKKEAELVNFATNPNNWKNVNIKKYSGSFFIDIDHPHECYDTLRDLLNEDGIRRDSNKGIVVHNGNTVMSVCHRYLDGGWDEILDSRAIRIDYGEYKIYE